jgi:hypothetical protein
VRRSVRTTEDFWATLDLALPAGKEPSWHAFAARDLPDALERFATDWDTLPTLVAGRAEYRLLIGTGHTPLPTTPSRPSWRRMVPSNGSRSRST